MLQKNTHMKLTEVLQQYNFSQQATDIFAKSGIIDLYPPQAEAVKKGILNGKNLVLAVPTAAGKTLIAELSFIKSIVDNNGRCLYIVPLKALASEKYKDFKKKYSSLGLNVGMAVGDESAPNHLLKRNHILIATAEKMDSLLRFRAADFVSSLSILILDEVHFINDGTRGPTLEILAARIRQLNPKIQVIALSATIKNANEIGGWLNADVVSSSWRPIPLKEGVYFNQRIHFANHGIKIITEEAPDDVGMLTLDTLRGQGQVLIFVNSRRSTQAVARRLTGTVSQILKPEEKKHLALLSQKIAGNQSDMPKVSRELAGVIAHGVAFHHAGLKPDQRELIEENFKSNFIKVICCTPTLAAGVNLPARRAIIRDCKRFESGLGSVYIPTSEYKQCAGRAGRPQYDKYGEAVLIAKSYSESEILFERYINADPEPIYSKLADETALRTHILASVAGGYVHDINSMFEFLKHTFLYYQRRTTDLLGTITEIFDFLHKEKFIEKSGYRFFATTFGSLTSRLYINPLTAMTIRNALKIIDEKNNYTPLGMLHLISCTPDAILLSINKKDIEDVERFANHAFDDLILTPQNTPALDDYYAYMATIKTLWLLNQWIEEEKEEIICDQFNIGPGDIFRQVEAAQWLLYAASMLADLFHKKNLTFRINDLRTRIRYGIKEELLEIVQLKGVGRIRSRILFKNGFMKLKDLQNASAEKLAGLPAIGKALAADIIKQANEKPKSTHLPTVEVVDEELIDLV